LTHYFFGELGLEAFCSQPHSRLLRCDFHLGAASASQFSEEFVTG
jgi:hypothetical protein